ncbi:superoxide dismutase [Mn], mitochondrial-like [Oppia nitens]|uniref:superoxide dismutase [Mn], mitochondrial-like n=1 Tax=Oppia nitens TaxID=1686743 RepID=UPI0023DC5FA4|nr:superoxide dismutase [Mn], mitochondrial-like [Oppia nitens]
MSLVNHLRFLPFKCAPLMTKLSSMVTVGTRNKHTLPDLPYDYNALEPVISAEIMQLHHQKHHQTYVNNLNVAEEKLHEAIAKNDISAQIALEPVLRFNGGGHINHTIFWNNLSPKCGGEPEGDLLNEIKSSFQSFESFKNQMSAAATAVQGSGWAWLGYCPKSNKLRIAACPNQDPLLATTGLVPLFGIDVWEHAYYLQYKNVRPDYVKAIWNVANWKDIEERLRAAKAL